MKNAIYETKSTPYTCHIQKQLSASPHLHKEIEIIYVHQGETLAHADRNCFPLKKGDIFISFPNQIHYYENCVPGEYLVFIFSPSLLFGLKATLNESIPKQNCLHISSNKNAQGFITQIENANGEYRDSVIAGYSNLLMNEILSNLHLKPRLQSDNYALKSILSFCEEHYCEEITLNTVSEQLHISRYYISRLLNREIALGFNDYVNTLRVNAACDLLAETNKKTADISEEVGFGTIRSFNRAFRNIMNMTPLQYRNLQQN